MSDTESLGSDPPAIVSKPVLALSIMTSLTITRGKGAHIGKIMGVKVDELKAVISFLFNVGNGQDQGFGPEVHPEHAIGGIRIGRNNSLIFRCEQA